MTTAWYARLNHAERHVWLIPLILPSAIGQTSAILGEVDVRIDCSSSTAQSGLEKK